MRAKKKILLFGKSVNLYARYTDVSLAFDEYVRNTYGEKPLLTLVDDIALSVEIIKDALQPNFDELKWVSIAGRKLFCLNFLKMLKYKKFFSVKHLFKFLTDNERRDFLEIIFFELEKRPRKAATEEGGKKKSTESVLTN